LSRIAKKQKKTKNLFAKISLTDRKRQQAEKQTGDGNYRLGLVIIWDKELPRE
jgi:hypothetical protein